MIRPLATLVAVALTAAAAAQSNRLELSAGSGWNTVPTDTGSLDRRILDLARRLIADDKPHRARRMLNDWIERSDTETNPYAAEAYRLRGDAKLAAGREDRALFDYDTVIQNYPGSSEYPLAVEREVDIAALYLDGLKRRLFGLPLRVVSGRGVAREILFIAQERTPGSRLAERAGITLADDYYKTRDLPLAAEQYEVILRNYPNSPYRQRAMRNRIYANIAGFKGPAYDGLGLLESRLLIREFAREYPAEAQRSLLTDAMIARIDESAAAQQLLAARWYLSSDDNAGAAFTLRRLLRDHPGTVAAARALQLLDRKGWLEQQPLPASEPIGPQPPESNGQ
jgi:outer membrane protein assembly factor BamD (BamD/ComL family)